MSFERLSYLARSPSSHRECVAAALLGVTMLLVTAAASAAPPTVYYSLLDDGAVPGSAPEVAAGAPAIVHLYIDGGSTPSTEPCLTGLADEICAWNLILEGQNGLLLLNFNGDGDIVSNLSGNVLRFNGGDVVDGTLGPTKLGDITIQGPEGAQLQLLTSTSVNSGMVGVTLPESTLVTVPEPGMAVGLIAGSAGIFVAGRFRKSV